jgi:ABC-type phosphate transport system substrate-binding protein
MTSQITEFEMTMFGTCWQPKRPLVSKPQLQDKKEFLMKLNIVKAVILAAALGSGFAASLHAESADVIVNPEVKASTLDKNALKDIYLGKTAYWEGGQAVNIIVLTDKTDAALQETTGMSASQFKTHWQRLTFSGRGKQPKEADSPEKLMALVASTKGAVALVPSGTPVQGAKKLEIK